MTDEQILELLADGHHPADVARYILEDEAANGEYDGATEGEYNHTEMEIGYTQHQARVERVLAQAGGA